MIIVEGIAMIAHQNLQTRLMLQHYELQLMTARRLARHRRQQLLEAEEEDTPPTPTPQEHRKRVVQQVARELYESMLSTGSENPMVEDIVQQLGRALGTQILLQYPTPGPLSEEHLRLLHVPEEGNGKPIPFGDKENRDALYKLWEIVLKTVEKSTV